MENKHLHCSKSDVSIRLIFMFLLKRWTFTCESQNTSFYLHAFT